MTNKHLINTPHDDFVDTLKEDINYYNVKCNEVLNWGEIHVFAILVATRGTHNIEHPDKVGDFNLEDLKTLVQLLKPFASKYKLTIDKVEFAFLYCLEICSVSIKINNGLLSLDSKRAINKHIRVFKNKADLDKNPHTDKASLIFSIKNVLNHFPTIQSCIQSQYQKMKLDQPIQKVKISSKKTLWKEFAFLLFCKLDAVTSNIKDRDFFYKEYLPRFYKKTKLIFNAETTDVEIAIKDYIEKFGFIQGSKSFSYYGSVENTIKSTFRERENSDMFTFYTNGEVKQDKIDKTINNLTAKYYSAIDDNHLISIQKFRENPSVFIKGC